MKFSITSAFAIFSLLTVSAIAAPVAAPVAVAAPNAIALADPIAIAEADPALSNLAALAAVNKAVPSITKDIANLTTLLTTSEASEGALGEVVGIVVDVSQSVITLLGNITTLEEGTTAINDLLDDTVAKLDAVLANSGLEGNANKVLDTLIDSVKVLLNKLLETISSVLEQLLKLNLIGVITSLLSGALASVDLFLTKLKNGALSY